MQPSQKICPECGTRAELAAGVCATCGHQFRTKFLPGPQMPQADQTQHPGSGAPSGAIMPSGSGQIRPDPYSHPSGHSPNPGQGQIQQNPNYGAFSGSPQGQIQQNPYPQQPGPSQPPQYGPLPPTFQSQQGYGAFGPAPGGQFGAWQQAPPGYISVPPGTINPWISVALSALCLPGAGQVYNKQIIKGVVVFITSLLSIVILPLILVWVVSLFDAYRIGFKLSQGIPVRQWEMF